MSFIWRGGNTLNGLTGFVSIGVLLGILVGLTALPISGCSQSASQSSADEMTASEGTGSSMKVQSTVPSDSSASEAAVATVPGALDAKAAPDAVSAAAVPAPSIPSVTSPTTPALAVAAPMSPSPVAPAKPVQASLPATAVAASTSPATVDVASTSPVLKGLNGKGMEGAAQTLNPAMMRALKEFQVASASFPDFCRDWARKLSVREHDNLGNIKWAMHDGVETGSYVGYGSIDSCTCKQASNGVAVGILTYKEFDYTLTGKSVEEAKHTTPHATTVVPTREIFAYEKGKWFW